MRTFTVETAFLDTAERSLACGDEVLVHVNQAVLKRLKGLPEFNTSMVFPESALTHWPFKAQAPRASIESVLFIMNIAPNVRVIVIVNSRIR